MTPVYLLIVELHLKKLVVEMTEKAHRSFLKAARAQGGSASFVIRQFCLEFSNAD